MKKLLLSLLITICLLPTLNAQWVQVSNGMGNLNVRSLTYKGNNLFAGTSPNTGVFKSTDNGTSWTQTSLNNQGVPSLAVNGNNLFAGTSSSMGIYKSTDNGTSWTQTSLNNLTVLSLAVNGNDIFAGTSSSMGVYKSTDNGTSWTQTSLNNRIILSLAVNGNNIFAGSTGYGAYLSTDNGTIWTQTSLNIPNVGALAANATNLFAGTGVGNVGTGVYLSTNNGTTWTQTSLNDRYVWSLAINGNNIFAGTMDYGVYVSNDNGTGWTQRNEGLGNLGVRVLFISNNYIFAGTEASVWRRPLGELTGIHQISSEIPDKFFLSQNYPNPFNPVTNIKFEISMAGFVELKIFDVLGREVSILVNEQLSPGTYEVDWDALSHSSGVYYYKIISGEYVETKKMILMK